MADDAYEHAKSLRPQSGKPFVHRMPAQSQQFLRKSVRLMQAEQKQKQQEETARAADAALVKSGAVRTTTPEAADDTASARSNVNPNHSDDVQARHLAHVARMTACGELGRADTCKKKKMGLAANAVDRSKAKTARCHTRRREAAAA